ncbi:DUF1648 domain-containing protein [Cryobacterium frigoriphilum]|nr:DUF1648 domain-containing protein [Cryobacterium frigoriphilum]
MHSYPARPDSHYEASALIRVLRWSGCGAALVGAAAVGLAYGSLPQQIPTHFGATGQADAWGPRWNVWPLLGVWLLLQVLLAFLSTKPHVFNYPVSVTKANAQTLYREGERLMVFLGVAVAVMFAGLTLLLVGAPGFALVSAGFVLLVVASAVGVGRMLRSPRG